MLISVERLVPGGRGMGRLPDGRIAFLTGVVPGDVVRLVRWKDKSSFVEVNEHQLAQPAKERVLPSCSIAHRCGGCDWMMISADTQREAKIDLLRQALLRTGSFQPEQLPHIAFTKSPRALGYRGRVRLHVRQGKVGYFSRRSNELVTFEECLVASPQLARAILLLKLCLEEFPREAKLLDALELRALLESDGSSIEPGSCTLHLVLNEGVASRALAPLLARLRQHWTVAVGQEAGALVALPPTCGGQVVTLAAPGAFTQVNWAVNAQLVSAVVDLAQAYEAKTFLDVYCGGGNFSLPLLALGLRGVGVEQSAAAIFAARAGAERAGLRGVFHAGQARQVLQSRALTEKTFDLAVIDPPRAGAKDVLGVLARMGIPHLLMISCDPVTLARDLRALVSEGYSVESLRIFDMFPQTHHFESLCVLRRVAPRPA